MYFFTRPLHFDFLALLVLVELGEAKVSDLDAEVLVKKKIRRLEVAVDDLEDLVEPNDSEGL